MMKWPESSRLRHRKGEENQEAEETQEKVRFLVAEMREESPEAMVRKMKEPVEDQPAVNRAVRKQEEKKTAGRLSEQEVRHV